MAEQEDSEELEQLKQRLAELEETAREYKDLFENARDVIVVFDLKGNVTAVNKAISDYGFVPEDLLGKNMLNFIAKKYWPRLLKELAQITKGNSVEGEIEVSTPRGQRVAEYRSNPIRRGGRIVGFQTILRDVTQRKQLKERLATLNFLGHKLVLLHDVREIAQTAVDAADRLLHLQSCGVWLVDEGKLVRIAHNKKDKAPEVNLQLDSDRGIIAASIRIGETIYLPDVSKDPRYIGGSFPARSELCIPLKVAGTVIGALNAESKELDAFSPEDRQLLQALANAVAVGLYNARLFEEVRKLEEFNESIVQNMTEGIILDDVDGVITFVNPAAARMLGYAPEELIGKHWAEIVPSDQRHVIEETYERRRRGRSDRYEIELLGKDGKRLPALVSGSPRFEGGEFVGTQAVITDISERKRAESRIRHLNAVLQSIRKVNQLITREKDRDRLLEGACDNFVKTRGYHSAWIALLDADRKLVTAVAAGLGEEFALLKEQLKRGHLNECTRRALRRPGVTVIEVPGSVCGDCPLLGKEPHERTMTTRLEHRGTVYGVLSVSIPLEFAFDPDEQRLFSEIADDVASALYRIELEEARKRTERQLELAYRQARRSLEGTVQALSAIGERRDPYTAGHSRRVAELACAIAEELGLPKDRIEGLRVAGLLHDIGKTSVPAEILAKPSRLTELEFDMIKAHPQVAYDILSRIDFPWPVAEIILQHHERLDGSGYPHGLKGEEILFEARILAVADVVEAMSSHRPYRPAHTLEEALEEIERGKGTLYDSQVVEACLRLFSEGRFSFNG